MHDSKRGSWSGRASSGFEHVSFAYVPGEPVLKNVSFEVRPGQRIGIVGATGSGKTTIVSLLLRFYDVQEGRITVDGVDIRDIDLADLRALFGLVLQDVQSVLRDDRQQRPARQRQRSPTTAVRRARRRGARRRASSIVCRTASDAGCGARRDVVGGAEAAAVVRARAGLRSAAC